MIVLVTNIGNEMFILTYDQTFIIPEHADWSFKLQWKEHSLSSMLHQKIKTFQGGYNELLSPTHHICINICE